MKKLISSFALLTFFAMPAIAGNPIENAEENLANWGRGSQVIQDVAVDVLLKTRCQKYFGEQAGTSMSPQKVKDTCKSAVASFMQILKPEIVRFSHPLSHIVMAEPAAFTKELDELMRSPPVSLFLRAWISNLELATLGLDDLDTFNLAAIYAGSDKEALRWMAVLFQDTSAARVQVQWLMQKHPVRDASLQENIDNLNKILGRMTTIFTGQFHTIKPVYFLTEQARTSAKTHLAMGSIYHYYVPAYVALRMTEEGQPKALAMMLPFLFNYLYEAIEQTSALPRLVSEPASMTNTHDTYLGFLGAAYGIDFEGPLWNQKEFALKMKTTKDSLSMMTGIVLRKYPF